MLFSHNDTKRTHVLWSPVNPEHVRPEGIEFDADLTGFSGQKRLEVYEGLFLGGAERVMVIRMNPAAVTHSLPERLLDYMVEANLEYAAASGLFCGTGNHYIEVFTAPALAEARSHDAALLPSFQLNGFGLHGEKSLFPLNDEDVHTFLEASFTGMASVYPAGITVDMTTRCNLRCKKCIYHGSDDGLVSPIENKDMDFAMFQQMVEEISCWERVPFLTLAMRGEPLLNKRLLDSAKLLYENAIPYGIVTNGILLTQSVLDQLCGNGLQYLCVSLDTNDAEAYESATGIDAFDKVVANVQRMLDAAHQGQLPTPMLNFVVSNYNNHEVDDYLDRWQGQCKILKIGQYQDLYTTRKPESLFFPPNRILPCPAAWSSMYVFSDGSVRRCCQEGIGSKPLGVFPKETLQAIWTGDEYQGWRHALANRTTDAKRFCQACAGWSKGLTYTVRKNGKITQVSPLVVSHIQPNEAWAETMKRNVANSSPE